MNATTAAEIATVDKVPAPRGSQFRATYEVFGCAAMGYGPTEAAARADLLTTLEFNVKYNGRLV